MINNTNDELYNSWSFRSLARLTWKPGLSLLLIIGTGSLYSIASGDVWELLQSPPALLIVFFAWGSVWMIWRLFRFLGFLFARRPYGLYDILGVHALVTIYVAAKHQMDKPEWHVPTIIFVVLIVGHILGGIWLRIKHVFSHDGQHVVLLVIFGIITLQFASQIFSQSISSETPDLSAEGGMVIFTGSAREEINVEVSPHFTQYTETLSPRALDIKVRADEEWIMLLSGRWLSTDISDDAPADTLAGSRFDTLQLKESQSIFELENRGKYVGEDDANVVVLSGAEDGHLPKHLSARWLASGAVQSVEGNGYAEFTIHLERPYIYETSVATNIVFGAMGCPTGLNDVLVWTYIDESYEFLREAHSGWTTPKECQVTVNSFTLGGDFLQSYSSVPPVYPGIPGWSDSTQPSSYEEARSGLADVRADTQADLEDGYAEVYIGIPPEAVRNFNTLGLDPIVWSAQSQSGQMDMATQQGMAYTLFGLAGGIVIAVVDRLIRVGPLGMLSKYSDEPNQK